MSQLWQTLLEKLWPSRHGPPVDQARRFVLLQAVIALAIALAAGPEVILAMEMTTLLEMLGASMFLTAFATGAKLTAIALRRSAYNIVLPAAQVAVMRSNAPPGSKALALIYVVVNATWCLIAVLIAGAYGQHLIELAI